LLFEKIWQRMSPKLSHWINGANLVCEKPSVCAFRKKFLKEGGKVDADHETRLAAVEKFIKETKLPVHHMLKDISFPSPDWSLYWDIVHLSKRRKQMNEECVTQKRKDLGIKYEDYIWRWVVQQNVAQSVFDQSKTIHPPPEEETTHRIGSDKEVSTRAVASSSGAADATSSASCYADDECKTQPNENINCKDMTISYTRDNETLYTKRVGELQRVHSHHGGNNGNTAASASQPINNTNCTLINVASLQTLDVPKNLTSPASHSVKRYEPRTITWFLQGKLDGQCARSDSAQVLPIEIKLRCKNGPWSGMDIHPHEILQNFTYEYLLNCDKGIIVEGKSCRVATQGTLSQPIIDMRSHQVTFDWVLFYRTYVPRVQRALQYMLYLDGDEGATREYFQCSRNGRTCLVGEAMRGDILATPP